MLQETQQKLRVAKSNLLESEHGRERRLKIIKKTHSSALSLKQALIQDLQDIIADKDESIAELRFRLRGCSCEQVQSKEVTMEVSEDRANKVSCWSFKIKAHHHASETIVY